ncbi:MAG: hypothetical protein HWD61_13260 [Parachlamydiaceae bacterium]|nr:MAG: hypothetical protein HWD61_13260 [Parachlamydiaceae bacterium]
MDSIDVGDAMVQMHYQAIMSVVDFMKPTAKKENPGKDEFEISEKPPQPYPYTEEDPNIRQTPPLSPYPSDNEEINTPDGGEVERFSNPFADEDSSSSESEGTHSNSSIETLQEEIERRRIQNGLTPPENQLH